MPEVILRIGGENAGGIAAVREFVAGLKDVKIESEQAFARVSAGAKESALTVQEQARKNVTSALEQRDALRGLVAEYGAVAKAAVSGSEEARQAHRLEMEGNAKLAATYDEVGVAASRAGAESAAASRKAREESGVARGFVSRTGGLSAFAGTAFIGGAIAGIAVKDFVKNAIDAQAALTKLDVALRDAHASVKALTPVLDEYNAAGRRVGFTDAEMRDAETRLVQAFGATKQSLGELRVAQDLARAKNEDLGTATRGLILLQEGNTRAAKEFGLALPNLTTAQLAQKAAVDGLNVSQERGKILYDELLPRIKGQAAAFANTPTGKMQEFHAEIQHTEETIGQALIPTVDKYLGAVDSWLAKSSNQKRITHDVETAVHDLAAVLKWAYDRTQNLLSVVNPVVRALGGWKTVLEGIIALKFADVLAGWLGPLGKLIGRGGALTSAEGASGGLLSNLRSLKLLGPIAVAITVDEIVKRITGSASDFSQGTAQDSTITVDGKRYIIGSGSAWTALVKAGWKPPKGVTVGNVTAQQEIGAAQSLGGSYNIPKASDGTTPGSAHSTLANPVPGGAFGRIDQGVDYSVRLVHAVADGVIVSVGGGFAGPAGQAGASSVIKQRFTNPISVRGRTYYGAYYAEGVPLVQAGDRIRAGEPIMKGGAVEIGFLLGRDLTLPPLLGGLGSKTLPGQSGQDFAALVQRLGGPAGGTGAASGSPYGPSTVPPPGPTTATTAGGPSGLAALGVPQSLQDRIARAAARGTAAHGEAAADWLETERSLMEQAIRDLRRKLHDPSLTAKQKDAIHKQITSYEDKITRIGTEIAKALVVTGDALLPKDIQRRVTAAAGRAKAAIASAQAATGTDVTAYYATAVAALTDEENAIKQEVARLRTRLGHASAPQKVAIRAEIKKLESSVASVASAVTSALQQEANAVQSTVSGLQSTVGSAWSSVSQGIVAAFEATTQSMIDAVGKQFFQGGQTPEEAALAAVQASDQVQSLQDAVAQAATPADRAAAQHQLDLYNLEQAATASRTKADQEYAAAVAEIQKKRQSEEEHLTVDLGLFGDGLSNGTKSFSDLQPLLTQYGVNLGAISDGSFIFKTNLDQLVASSTALDTALRDLAVLIGKITGKPVHLPPAVGAAPPSASGTHSTPSTGVGIGGHFATGGIVPGPMIGPEDTVTARVSTGEGVLSRDEMRMLLTAAIGGRTATSVSTRPIYVLGATKDEVGRALARIITPAQRRSVGFKDY